MGDPIAFYTCLVVPLASLLGAEAESDPSPVQNKTQARPTQIARQSWFMAIPFPKNINSSTRQSAVLRDRRNLIPTAPPAS